MVNAWPLKIHEFSHPSILEDNSPVGLFSKYFKGNPKRWSITWAAKRWSILFVVSDRRKVFNPLNRPLERLL